YSKTSSLTFDPHRVGNILETDFTLGIYPFTKSDHIKIDYSIAVAENENVRTLGQLELFNSQTNARVDVIERERMKMRGLHSNYFLTDHLFDYMKIGTGTIKNILIPKFREHH